MGADLGREDEATEFIEGLERLDEGILSLTSMVNRRGRATVLFGVDDDGNIIGDGYGTEHINIIRDRVRAMVEPEIPVDVVPEEVPSGMEYIRMSAVSSDIPYSFDGRYYYRDGTSDELATVDILRRMVMCGAGDRMVDLCSNVQELTFTSFLAYLESSGVHVGFTREHLRDLGMLTESGDYNQVAYLMSDQNNTLMQVVRFDGMTKASAITYRTDFGNRCLLLSMRAVLDYIWSMNETKVEFRGGMRLDTHLFDIEAFREAWINACVHNYWADMLPPAVFVFDDRIEIFSRGGIPFLLSEDDFLSGRSMPLNKALHDIVSMVDFTGYGRRGVPAVVERYGKETIEASDHFVTVRIPFSFTPIWVSSRDRMPRND